MKQHWAIVSGIYDVAKIERSMKVYIEDIFNKFC